MRKLWLFFSVAAAVTTACGSSAGADPDLDAWTREVRVLTADQLGGRGYEEVGALEEREPIGGATEEWAVSAAKERLRRRAARIDADAVVIVECRREARRTDPLDTRPLQNEVICRGVAIRWTDT
jgi:hypothetical protein